MWFVFSILIDRCRILSSEFGGAPGSNGFSEPRGGASVPRPDLILLDLNLPRKDGRQVLEEIKVNRALMTIPIVILTTSASEEDVLREEFHGQPL